MLTESHDQHARNLYPDRQITAHLSALLRDETHHSDLLERGSVTGKREG